MKQEKRWFYVMVGLSVLWILFIFWHSLQTAEASSQESGRILEFVRKLLPFMPHTLLRKMGHFAEFTVLGLLLSGTMRVKGLPRKPAALSPGLRHWAVPLGAGLLTAVCDESIQLFVPGRSAEVRDVLIDVSGVLLGTALTALAAALFGKKERKPGTGGKNDGKV